MSQSTISNINLDAPGRLRAKQLILLLSISKATFYKRLKDGDYPSPSGKDGRITYWNTHVIKEFLER